LTAYLPKKKETSSPVCQGLECFNCGGQKFKPHNFYDGPNAGAFCPNCGIEVNLGIYRLDGISEKVNFGFKRNNVIKSELFWDPTQVPFPNRTLIKKTEKPALVFLDLNF